MNKISIAAAILILAFSACFMETSAQGGPGGGPGNPGDNGPGNNAQMGGGPGCGGPGSNGPHMGGQPGSAPQTDQPGAPGNQNGGNLLSDLSEDLNLTISEGEKPDEIVAAIKTAIEALDSDALAELTAKYHIDTTDMDDAAVRSALEALLTPPENDNQPERPGGQPGQKDNLLESMAEFLNVTITDGEKPDEVLTALKAAVEALDSNALAELAAKYQIDTANKDHAAIVAAIEMLLNPPAGRQTLQPDGQDGGLLESMAAYLGLTISKGETPDKTAAAIKAAIEALNSDALAELAAKYHIDTANKEDAAIITALEALLTPGQKK